MSGKDLNVELHLEVKNEKNIPLDGLILRKHSTPKSPKIRLEVTKFPKNEVVYYKRIR